MAIAVSSREIGMHTRPPELPLRAVQVPSIRAGDVPLRAMILTHERERRRVSRDLHDVVGQALTAVRMSLEALRREHAADTGPVGLTDDALRSTINVVDQAMHDVREIAIDLRPAVLDDLGLVAAARWYLARQARSVGYRHSFWTNGVVRGVGEELETACFRSLQEALTNVARHARAASVQVELRQTARAVTMVVADDGVGFDVTRTRRQAARRGALGLVGLAERVDLAGGTLSLTSEPGQGTRICAVFPRPGAVDRIDLTGGV